MSPSPDPASAARRLRRPDPVPHLAAVAAASAVSGDPGRVFAALDRATAAAIGHKLFTIMVFHERDGQSERAYSSLPASYPVGGRKPVSATPWKRQVIDERRPFIGRGPDEIRTHFFDHELILSLGCQAIVNLPVVHDGRMLGTMNLLHEAAWYHESDVPLGLVFASLAIPGYLQLPP